VTVLRLDGADTLRFLHGQTSQTLASARPGQWLATCCISPTARMRALAEVLVDTEGAWLVIGEGDGAAVREALDRVLFPADQVRLGALEAATWWRSTLPDGHPEGFGHWRMADHDGGWWLGRSLVLRSGAPRPAGWAERPTLPPQEQERWRIQRGWPSAPAEINDGTNPFELGLADRVSLNKGCYVGQETLAKLATYDGVKQQLRRWSCAGPKGSDTQTLVQGAILHHREGERAGMITSLLDLGNEGWIGLALVRRGWLGEPSLLVGEEAAEVELRLSVPEDFQAPPVGSGTPGTPRSG
jgi:folate-binding protein YgfZ